MGPVTYILCTLTSLVCFGLLIRSYVKTKVRLLLWCSLCFFFFSIQNVLLFIDFILVPEISMIFWRTLIGFVGAAILLFGLIWEKN